VQPTRATCPLPSLAFLREVEQGFGLKLPAAFVEFCRRYADVDVLATFPGLRRGAFILDSPTLQRINTQIGEEEWGDYERIIARQQHPKSGLRFWGGLVPFYYDQPKNSRRRKAPLAESVYGFSSDEPASASPGDRDRDRDRVLVWSVHTIVHGYPSLDAWLAEKRVQ
jgi:hypothetical protein